MFAEMDVLTKANTIPSLSLVKYKLASSFLALSADKNVHSLFVYAVFNKSMSSSGGFVLVQYTPFVLDVLT